ncbi:integrase [Rhodobacter aestuarii]|uniref:Integrase n=2 Tax=Rhodobacter aestuarii TaxID=453582 RepID=A0A1N7Q2M2_9RHOB|nr:integrase arm-type DNA-binding domain-containing protein [Rhodobacter aestuarii]PTV94060.1 integrase [Rhodobacter aestuarii]SIT17133.1 Integrase [Rhodobacter aestuarii]
MPLSDVTIRNLKPRDRSYKVSDFDGLFVLVKPTGARLWQFKYRIDGKEKLLSIGRYPEIGLAQARLARDEARSMVANGRDPSAAKQERKRAELERRGVTFETQAQAFLEKTRKEGLASTTLAKNEWLLAMAIADFGAKPMSEISAQMILRCLRKVEAKGNYETAKRLRAKISAVFRYAVANGVAETDPTYALRDALVRPKAKPRAAIIDPQALGGLMRAIETYTGQRVTKIALELLALMVPRPGELRQARWEEIDLDARIWAIPAERMKMRRPHRIPLSDRAVRLLHELRELTGWTGFLLPSLVSPRRVMSENTLNTALRRMGFGADEMTSHGFRASFSTLANESGLWNPDAIERALAHIEQNDVRRAYARGEHWDERVRLAQWWADYLETLRTSA